IKLIIAKKRGEYEMLKEKDPEIKKAVMLLEELSEDEETRILADIRERAMRDEYDRHKTATRIGKEKGLREGLKKGRLEGRLEGIQVGEAKGIIMGKEEGFREGEAKGIVIGKEEGFREGEAKGIVIGKEEGFREGEAKEKREMAITMLKDGFSPKNVAKYTSLSIDEINELKRSLN
ncbi:MAG: hypothetical protein FWC47_13535, partial [Oscillospiraceae bacterium]|nr:hypothetical protein [Oscillospiraceae bacterium]